MPDVTINESDQLRALKLPPRVRGTFLIYLMGYDPYFLMSRETFYRHAGVIKKKIGTDIVAARKAR